MAFAFGIQIGQVEAAQCVNLTRDLSQGMSDASAGGQVTMLQNYLVSAGYLASTPNGYFGPATLAAVKRFQTVNGISALGTVGPLTRVALNIKSCASSVPVPTPAVTPTPVSTPLSQPGITAGSPRSGESLNLDDAYTVKWTAPAGTGPYNVILEDSSGTPQGFIVSGTYATSYTWTVGVVHNSSSASTDTVPPGTYRIHAEASGGAQTSDVLSATFTIAASISISQIFPHAVAADGNRSVVIYGSDFKPTSMVDIYGYGTVPPQFVSADGRVIVFAVPTGVYPGPHTVTVLNRYGSSDVTTESNSSDLIVVRP